MSGQIGSGEVSVKFIFSSFSPSLVSTVQYIVTLRSVPLYSDWLLYCMYCTRVHN